MVGLKLHAIKVSDYTATKINVITFPRYYYFGLDHRYTLYTGLSYDQLVAIHQQYNLFGRKLNGTYQGQPTSTIIQNIGYLSSDTTKGIIYINNWSNQIADVNSLVRCDTHSFVNPFTMVSDIDVSENLIEEDISVTYKLESNLKFDLEGSFGNISLLEDSALQAFMNTYWVSYSGGGDKYMFGVELLRDGVGEYWAYSNIQDIRYDEVEKKYIINSYDWLKYFQETIGTNPLGNFSGYLTLELALTSIFPFFSSAIGRYVNGLSEILNYADYRSYFNVIGAGGEWLSMEEETTVNQFIEEVQKHYGAFLYYKNKDELVLANRNHTFDTLNINNLIIENTFERSFRITDFRKLLIHIKDTNSSWSEYGTVTDTFEGWAFVYLSGGNLMVEVVQNGETQLQNAVKDYLDLRQKFYGEAIYGYVLFAELTPEQVYENYKELLEASGTYTCSLDTLDVSLQTKITYGSATYSVIEVKKDYLTETSDIIMVKTQDGYPNPFN